jgi:hypothetical protein
VRATAAFPSPQGLLAFLALNDHSKEWNNHELPKDWFESEEQLEIITFASADPRAQRALLRFWVRPGHIIELRSRRRWAAARAAYFLLGESDGSIAERPEGPFRRPDSLLAELEGFEVEKGYERYSHERRRLPDFFVEHYPFIAERVQVHLTDLPPYDDRNRQCIGRCSHPNTYFWVGKGYESYTNYAADADVPDNFFACIELAYPHSEWAFILWKMRARKFWFGALVGGMYRKGDQEKSITHLHDALGIWDHGTEDVYMLFDSGTSTLLKPSSGGT